MNTDRKDRTYWNLARHLDRLPGGFESQDHAVERRLLERLFTPEEAKLAIQLTLEREDAATIAARAGLPLEETESRLDEMAQKGLILSIMTEKGALHYQAVPWVVGIYEFQVDRLDDELLQMIFDYWLTRKPREKPTGPQMRTIPIGESIDLHHEVLPYEQINALIAAEDHFAVAPCICRHAAKIAGVGCEAPEEACLVFGEWADYFVRTGRGRPIDIKEVKDILTSADATNLVLQPSNSQEAAFICCCCGCCCGMLMGIKLHPRPSEVVVNAFIAQLEPELCTNCETCLERCQVDALTPGLEHVVLNTIRCIGCGLCVSTCPTAALTLIRKPDYKKPEPARTFQDTLRNIMDIQDTC